MKAYIDVTKNQITDLLNGHKKFMEHGNMDGSRAVFRDLYLDGFDFSGMDLRYVEFYDCTLIEANFTRSNLKAAYFNRTILDRANFEEANLDSMAISFSDLLTANVKNATICNIHFFRNREGTDFYIDNSYNDRVLKKSYIHKYELDVYLNYESYLDYAYLAYET